MLRSQQDQINPVLKARYNRIEEFGHRIQNDIQFFHLTVGRIPREKQARFLEYEGLKP